MKHIPGGNNVHDQYGKRGWRSVTVCVAGRRAQLRVGRLSATPSAGRSRRGLHVDAQLCLEDSARTGDERRDGDPQCVAARRRAEPHGEHHPGMTNADMDDAAARGRRARGRPRPRRTACPTRASPTACRFARTRRFGCVRRAAVLRVPRAGPQAPVRGRLPAAHPLAAARVARPVHGRGVLPDTATSRTRSAPTSGKSRQHHGLAQPAGQPVQLGRAPASTTASATRSSTSPRRSRPTAALFCARDPVRHAKPPCAAAATTMSIKDLLDDKTSGSSAGSRPSARSSSCSSRASSPPRSRAATTRVSAAAVGCPSRSCTGLYAAIPCSSAGTTRARQLGDASASPRTATAWAPTSACRATSRGSSPS